MLSIELGGTRWWAAVAVCSYGQPLSVVVGFPRWVTIEILGGKSLYQIKTTEHLPH